MKLYRISQNVNREYDTYSDAVVAADNEEEAKRIHPGTVHQREAFYDEEKKKFMNRYSSTDKVCQYEPDYYGSWTNDIEKIKAEEIGTANENQKKGVICASFHAG